MLLLASFTALLLSSAFASTPLNIIDFGAKGDGKALDTHAVVAAFAFCSSVPSLSLPCVINFPAPHKFLLSPFNVSSNTVLAFALCHCCLMQIGRY
jgi:hypothetical protein